VFFVGTREFRASRQYSQCFIFDDRGLNNGRDRAPNRTRPPERSDTSRAYVVGETNLVKRTNYNRQNSKTLAFRASLSVYSFFSFELSTLFQSRTPLYILRSYSAVHNAQYHLLRNQYIRVCVWWAGMWTRCNGIFGGAGSRRYGSNVLKRRRIDFPGAASTTGRTRRSGTARERSRDETNEPDGSGGLGQTRAPCRGVRNSQQRGGAAKRDFDEISDGDVEATAGPEQNGPRRRARRVPNSVSTAAPSAAGVCRGTCSRRSVLIGRIWVVVQKKSRRRKSEKLVSERYAANRFCTG